jgi:hypothetical protein
MGSMLIIITDFRCGQRVGSGFPCLWILSKRKDKKAKTRKQKTPCLRLDSTVNNKHQVESRCDTPFLHCNSTKKEKASAFNRLPSSPFAFKGPALVVSRCITGRACHRYVVASLRTKKVLCCAGVILRKASRATDYYITIAEKLRPKVCRAMKERMIRQSARKQKRHWKTLTVANSPVSRRLASFLSQPHHPRAR